MKIEYENLIKEFNENFKSINHLNLSKSNKKYNSFFVVAPPRGGSTFFSANSYKFHKNWIHIKFNGIILE